jgi:glutamine cyclotransferase
MFTTDGSDKIYVVDENFTLLSEIGIKNSLGNPQTNINELEFVGGFIYANVYMTTKIIKIDIK